MSERAEHWEREQYLPSILPSLAASQYARLCLTWPEASLGSAVHLKRGGGGMWAVAVWLSDWGCEARAAWDLHSASSARHWASLCPRSRRRLQQQIAVKSQGPSPAPQPSRISMRRTAAPSVMWDVPTRPGHLLCFTRLPGQGGAEGWSWGRGQGWGTANCHNGHPLWLYPFLSFSVFPNKSGIKKTDGHGYTWVWSYSFTPLSFDVFCFCPFLSVPDSDVDPEIVLVHLGHGGVFVCVLSVGFCVWIS